MLKIDRPSVVSSKPREVIKTFVIKSHLISKYMYVIIPLLWRHLSLNGSSSVLYIGASPSLTDNYLVASLCFIP